METNQQDDGAPESRWSGLAISAGIAALPLLVAVIRLLVYARGDAQVLAGILSSVNLATIWVTLVALSFPLVALCLPGYMMIVFVLWRSPENLEVRRSGVTTAGTVKWAAGTLVLSLVLSGLFVSGWLVILGPIAVVGVAAGVYFGDRMLSRHKGETREQFGSRVVRYRRSGTRMSRRSTLWSLPFLALMALLMGPVGLPVEFVKANGETALNAGYVVGVDDTALTLAYLDGGIRRIPTGDVEGRYVCPSHAPEGGLSSQPRTGLQVLIDTLSAAPPYVPPECVTPDIRTH